MSKKNHPLNAHQFKLFYRPHELMALDSVDVGYAGTEQHAEGWENKLEEAHMSGVADSVWRNGVQRPVIIQTEGPKWPAMYDKMGNGHHRVAAAASKEAALGEHQYIPAIHDEDFMGWREDGSRNSPERFLRGIPRS